MKSAVIVFPGSNCDHDVYYALQLQGMNPEFVWHSNPVLNDFDLVVLPGGFSYGDYLRAGAIARFSPIMSEVIRHARKGKLVLGICNGFQILTEAHLLPGALLRNANLRFVCHPVYIRVESHRTPFTAGIPEGTILKMPVAHGEGNYFIDDEGLQRLQEHQQIVFRYVNRNGEPTEEANPNGSLLNIAGICNEQGNILGMMPHPERAMEVLLGSEDGQFIFKSLLS